jgi:hypothetical protein
MIEVGSGYSSLITAEVNRRFLNMELEFSCIEPYPRQFLMMGIAGISNVFPRKVETIDPVFFSTLSAGDFLFIDSSHVPKTGSDVNYLYFEILPRLKSGVIVHIHDIFFPDDYPKKWVIDEGRHWNEQYLLRAFLQFNKEWEILFCNHFMFSRHQTALQKAFTSNVFEDGGASFWMRRR